jgi:hypothetical protein
MIGFLIGVLEIISMYASMPHGNDQNISFSSATSQAKRQCAVRRPKIPPNPPPAGWVLLVWSS